MTDQDLRRDAPLARIERGIFDPLPLSRTGEGFAAHIRKGSGRLPRAPRNHADALAG